MSDPATSESVGPEQSQNFVELDDDDVDMEDEEDNEDYEDDA